MKLKHTVVGLALSAALLAPSLQAAPPGNDNFANATVITGSTISQNGTNVDATTEIGEPSLGFRTIWYSWTAPSGGTLTVDTIGTGFDTLLGIYTGPSYNDIFTIRTDDDGGGNGTSLITTSVTGGTVYKIKVCGYSSSETGPTVLNLSLVPFVANNDFANAAVISGPSGTLNADNTSSNTEPGEPGGGMNSLWYAWTAPATGKIVFDTYGSELDTLLGVYTGTAVNALSLVSGGSSNDHPLSEYGESLVKISVTSGTTYYVRVAVPSFGAPGALKLNWSSVSQPANDHFANAEVITGASGSINAYTFDATLEDLEINYYDDTKSIWYAWTAPFTGLAEFNTDGTIISSTLTVSNNGDLGSLNVVSDSVDFPSSCIFPVVTGTTYKIRISTNGEMFVKLNWLQSMAPVPSVISFANATYTSSEAGPSATITLTRNAGASTGPVSCYLLTYDGSANGSDYSPTYTQVSFADGVTTASVNIPIFQDRRFEGEETFQVHLFSPSAATAFGLSVATINIADDEPFIPLKANYAGLSEVFPFDPALTGLVKINATGNGSFTGSLALGGIAAAPFSGTFGAGGKSTVTVTRKTGGNVLLNLFYADNGNRIRCLVSLGNKTADLQAWRIIFGGAVEVDEKPFAFTAQIARLASAQGSVPKADGYACISVGIKGDVKVAGILADDTPFTAAGPLCGYDMFPLYVSLYKGKGVLSADVVINKGSSDTSHLTWYKSPVATDKVFPAGFTQTTTLETSPYVFSKRTPILSAVNNTQGAADFFASGLGLPAEGITQVFRLLEDNSIALPLAPQVKLTLKFAPATGTFTGTFQRTTEKPTPFKGAVFQRFDSASGFFLAPQAGGSVIGSGAIDIMPAYD